MESIHYQNQEYFVAYDAEKLLSWKHSDPI